MNLDSIRKFLKGHTGVLSIVTFVLGFFFGPGFFWQYRTIEISEQKLLIDKIRLENDLRKQILDIQNEITNKGKDYLVARDKYQRLKGKGPLGPEEYSIQNQYNFIKATMIKLISDYNILEAKLSQLEKRKPIFFDPYRIIPPPGPKDLRVEQKNNQVHATWKWDEDEVITEVYKNLKSLYELHGQKFSSEKKPEPVHPSQK
jgi:hypothetical protein